MKIEHVAMYVDDLEKSKDFFIKYFNCQTNDLYHNQKTGFKSYFLSFEEGSRLELMHKENLESKQVKDYLGYAHIALSVGSKERVDELAKKLNEDGYKIISGPRTTGDGYYECAILGIENNLIEITV